MKIPITAFPVSTCFLNLTQHCIMFDILILGGGPAGYTAAERAGAQGLSVLLIESRALGGVCLNEGCIPTKTLLYSAKIIDAVRNASKYAVATAGCPVIDLEKLMSRKNKIIRKSAAGIKMRLKEKNVTVIEGKGHILGKNDTVFTVACGDQTFSGKNVLICTGSSSMILSIDGIGDIDFWTSREALAVKELPHRLAVIGGGVIGMEFAAFFSALGVKVSVFEMMDEILTGTDKEIAGMLRAEYAKRGVDFYLETEITSVNEIEVTAVDKEGKQISVSADKILLCVGRKPQTEGFGLECLDLEKTHNNGIRVDEYMQTSQPGVYACGDVTGYSLLAHSASREAEVAVNRICGIKDNMSYKAVPSVVYTNPEIAGVGYTEEQLLHEKIPYAVLKLPMTFSGRFIAENEGLNGLCKILVDSNNIVKGVHLFGNPASEFITAATMAIEANMTVEQWQKIIFPHPTVHEILKEVCFTR